MPTRPHRLQSMLRHPRLYVLASSLVASLALAQSGPSLAGHYALATSRSAAEATIERAIDAATKEMGPLRGHVARNRLEAKNPVLGSIDIAVDESRVRIGYGDHTFAIQRGAFGAVRTPDGETAQARATLEGNRLTVDWRLDQGSRRDVFVREGDTLRLSIQISHEQLPADMRYRLRFRAGG